MVVSLESKPFLVKILKPMFIKQINMTSCKSLLLWRIDRIRNREDLGLVLISRLVFNLNKSHVGHRFVIASY